MSATYGVGGLSPFGEFSIDIEDIVIDYLYDEWSIVAPAKLAKPALPHAAGQDLNFFPGFPRSSGAFQVLCIQTDTLPLEPDVSMHSWKMRTTCEITMVVTRFNIDNIDPELGIMEREIERIINQYTPYEIQGISNIYFKGKSRIYDDTIAGGRTSQTVRRGSAGSTHAFSKTWVSRIYMDVEYYKVDTS